MCPSPDHSLNTIASNRLAWNLNRWFCRLLAIILYAGCLQVLPAADPPDLLDPKKVLETLPRDLVKEMGARSKEDRKKAIAEATQKLGAIYDDKPGTLSFKIARKVQYQGACNLFSETEKVRVGGVEIAIYYSVFLDKSENDLADKLRVGDRITATGLTRSVHMDDTVILNLRLGIWQAKLK